ncbi:hypothetical protein [Actibacterium ureilyticum]|uniref:hypothetical protein n=1 Tax=Actibacterium ureilyticum TaxID=1590614 RepID=UPI001140D2A3|nr:hypothetical protein [Actibacterium ureilyticum]
MENEDRFTRSTSSLEHFSAMTETTVNALSTNAASLQKDKATLREFLEGVGKRTDRSGDMETLNLVSTYLDRSPGIGEDIVNALEGGWKAEKIDELLIHRAELLAKSLERNAMRHAESEARSTANELYSGDHPLAEHADRLGYHAGQRAASRAQIAEHEHLTVAPWQDGADPSVIGMLQTAMNFVNQSRDDGDSNDVSLYEAYEALVATNEDPEGQVAEIDVIRAIQIMEAGEIASIDGNAHELAIRLRLALDAGVEPDTHISEALLLPEAAFERLLSKEQEQTIKEQLSEFEQNRPVDHDRSSFGFPAP